MSEEIAILKKMCLLVGLPVVLLGTLIVINALPTGQRSLRRIADQIPGIKQSVRRPASISSVQTARTEEIDLGCRQIQKPVCNHCADEVRLTGHDCGTQKFWKVKSIRNVTNGFSANVFRLDHGRYTTDYLELQPGANSVVVQLASQRGQTKSLTFTLVSSN